jgi:hypothetical protein
MSQIARDLAHPLHPANSSSSQHQTHAALALHARASPPLTPLPGTRKICEHSSLLVLLSFLFCYSMQHESVVIEDDIVNYSIFVDEYINLGKDANIDDLRAVLIDSLAFMYVDFFRYGMILPISSLFLLEQVFLSDTFGKWTAFLYPYALIMTCGTFTDQAVSVTISKTNGSLYGFFFK